MWLISQLDEVCIRPKGQDFIVTRILLRLMNRTDTLLLRAVFRGILFIWCICLEPVKAVGLKSQGQLKAHNGKGHCGFSKARVIVSWASVKHPTVPFLFGNAIAHLLPRWLCLPVQQQCLNLSCLQHLLTSGGVSTVNWETLITRQKAWPSDPKQREQWM